MKNVYSKLILLMFLICVGNIGFSQCTNLDPNGFGSPFPSTTFTPACSSTPTVQNITTTAWAGEYSNVNVVSGNTYVFSSSNPTDYITIQNNTSLAIIVFGTTGSPSLTWLSNLTGVVRFWTHTSGPATCGVAQVSRTRSVSCLSSAPDPCLSAINLPCGTSSLAGTTVGAVSSAHGTGCLMSSFGAWYSFTGDGQSTTITSVAGAGFDHEMAIASGSCGTLANIACRDLGGTAGSETYTFTATNGVLYKVVLGNGLPNPFGSKFVH